MRNLLLLGLLLCSSMAFALQIKPVNNNQTVKAFIAKKDKTRLFVLGDRITSIHGTPNAYAFNNDNVRGQVYIMPTASFQTKRFNLFVTTESGNTYGIIVTPVDRLADSIMLKPMGDRQKASHWELASNYQGMMIELIRDMVNGVLPEGYDVTTIHQHKPYYLGNIATLYLHTVYQGAHLKGEIYRLHNRLNKPITISETEFYQRGARAIVIDQHTIPAHGTTTVYGVMSNG